MKVQLHFACLWLSYYDDRKFLIKLCRNPLSKWLRKIGFCWMLICMFCHAFQAVGNLRNWNQQEENRLYTLVTSKSICMILAVTFGDNVCLLLWQKKFYIKLSNALTSLAVWFTFIWSHFPHLIVRFFFLMEDIQYGIFKLAFGAWASLYKITSQDSLFDNYHAFNSCKGIFFCISA